MKNKFKNYTKKFFRVIGKYLEFSKLICYIMTALVLYVSYKVLGFADTSINNGYLGSLPYDRHKEIYSEGSYFAPA